MNVLDHLNTEQQLAVTANDKSLLVLAGAGSGKTRVLVHRMGWLIENGLSPHSIFAVTFTNKAAKEMLHRIEHLLGLPAHGLWIGTFHGLAHRLLRMHWQEAKLPQEFQILDADDQARVIKRLYNSLHIDDEKWPVKQAQWFINQKKDEGIRARHLKQAQDMFAKTMATIYHAYEETCLRSGLVDFAELLLRTYETLQENTELLQHYQRRFEHILVDEFQDTNAIQYQFIRLLIGTQGAMTIVGDDDQSIYGWRGAKVENIHDISRVYAGTKIIRLEQNYRSTQTILNAANAVIAHNNGRMGKKLWTDSGKGESIKVYHAFNEIDEARFIVERIHLYQKEGHQLQDIAVLYRSNAQSRIIEENLMHKGIAYRVYGGLRFFDRAEIKDALAYLRLIANTSDDAAFERVINTPTRGIGERTLGIIREQARLQQIPLWDACVSLLTTNQLTDRSAANIENFLTFIRQWQVDSNHLPLHELTEHVIKQSGLIDHWRKEKGEQGLTRIENLAELANAARQFTRDDSISGSTLSHFLSHAALEAGENQSDNYQDAVQLMTLHSAKGLEFPLVFLCGMEEGLFPHQMSYDNPDKLEEERRLCYVGITRAMRQLFLTYAEVRSLYGKERYNEPSRFLREIPAQYFDEIRMGKQTTNKKYSRSSATTTRSGHTSGLRVGLRVHHPTFGDGVIVDMQGEGEDAKIQVQFAKIGIKWLVYQYARLTT